MYWNHSLKPQNRNKEILDSIYLKKKYVHEYITEEEGVGRQIILQQNVIG